MFRNIVGVLKYMALAIVIVGVMAAPAKADLVYTADFLLAGPLGSPAEEEAFLEGLGLSVDFLAKWDADAGSCTEGGSCAFTSVVFNDTTADVSWDFTGTGTTLSAVLLKDGTVQTDEGAEGHLYTLWLVAAGQEVTSNGIQTVHFGPPGAEIPKGVSHVSFFGNTAANGVPEPTTLVLLGAGLLGTTLLRRRAK